MSTVRKIDFITVKDYLAGEQQSSVKQEYVPEMVIARNAHNIFASNLLRLLFSQLQGKPCQGFNSDTKMRVRMSNETRCDYSDASVVCRPNPQSDMF